MVTVRALIPRGFQTVAHELVMPQTGVFETESPEYPVSQAAIPIIKTALERADSMTTLLFDSVYTSWVYERVSAFI